MIRETVTALVVTVSFVRLRFLDVEFKLMLGKFQSTETSYTSLGLLTSVVTCERYKALRDIELLIEKYVLKWCSLLRLFVL